MLTNIQIQVAMIDCILAKLQLIIWEVFDIPFTSIIIHIWIMQKWYDDRSYLFALDRSNFYFYLDAIDDFSSLRLNEQFTKYHLTDDRHLALSYSHEVRNVYLLVCIWYCVSQTNFIRLKREFLDVMFETKNKSKLYILFWIQWCYYTNTY